MTTPPVGSSETGWWLNHPSEKYARQIGNLPQIGVKFFKKMKPPPKRGLQNFEAPDFRDAHPKSQMHQILMKRSFFNPT